MKLIDTNICTGKVVYFDTVSRVPERIKSEFITLKQIRNFYPIYFSEDMEEGVKLIKTSLSFKLTEEEQKILQEDYKKFIKEVINEMVPGQVMWCHVINVNKTTGEIQKLNLLNSITEEAMSSRFREVSVYRVSGVFCMTISYCDTSLTTIEV